MNTYFVQVFQPETGQYLAAERFDSREDAEEYCREALEADLDPQLQEIGREDLI